MSSSARQTTPHEVPLGTRLVLYTCLPASPGEAADHSMASTRRHVADVGWEAVETYVDRAAPFESRALCEGRRNALAAVEQGRAAGIVVPLLVTPGQLEEDRANLAAWQARTRALITTPWAVVDSADSTALRRSAA